jgi:hypothetical protein
MPAIDLPTADTSTAELSLAPDEFDVVRVRAVAEGLAPDREGELLRYLVYLGAAYLEAEQVVDEASSAHDGYDELHRRFGAVSAGAAVLRFHWAEAARTYADEQRAATAHGRGVGGYEALVEKLEDEIATREDRILHLEEALAA